MLTPIEVFFHLYIPGDWKHILWTQYLDNLMGKLSKSKLLEISNINLVITMPRYWTKIGSIEITKHNDSQVILNFDNKIREYVSLRYPQVSILDIRDISEQNIYEGQTLKLLHEKSKITDSYFLYCHSKGSFNFHPLGITNNWVEILDYFIIEKWTYHINKLKDVDVTGVKDLISSDLVMSGNFWWSKSEYLKTLLDPLDTESYFEPMSHTYRYAFERWVMAGNPKYNYIVDTKTNHYTTNCFLENLK
jgi:hypothetical protein